MTTYGYARVSTRVQSLQSQLDALSRAGVAPDHIETDIASGHTWGAARPGLFRLLPKPGRGDVLVVTALDRVTRRLLTLLEVMETLAMRGIELRSLAENIDTTSASGGLAFQMFGVLAEFERKRLSERVAAGMAAARANGVHTGRPALFTPGQAAVIRKLADEGQSAGVLARTFRTTRSTIRRVVLGLPPYPLAKPPGRIEAPDMAAGC